MEKEKEILVHKVLSFKEIKCLVIDGKVCERKMWQEIWGQQHYVKAKDQFTDDFLNESIFLVSYNSIFDKPMILNSLIS